MFGSLLHPDGWTMWSLKKAWQVVVFVIGGTVVLVGVILLFTPGPAFIVIPFGLAILATEFVWARRLLKTVKDRIQQSAHDLLGPNHSADPNAAPRRRWWKFRR